MVHKTKKIDKKEKKIKEFIQAINSGATELTKKERDLADTGGFLMGTSLGMIASSSCLPESMFFSPMYGTASVGVSFKAQIKNREIFERRKLRRLGKKMGIDHKTVKEIEHQYFGDK